MYDEVTHLQKYFDDVHKIDKLFNLKNLDEPNVLNLMFFTVALCGEAGEMANVVKKIVRNGATDEKLARLREELADILIYFCKILDIIKGDFDAAWDYKHKVLATTRKDRLGDYTITNKAIRKENK